MKYQNKQNGNTATLISKNDKFKTVELQMADGTVKQLTLSTFKRWWKQISEEEINTTEEIVPAEESLDEPPEDTFRTEDIQEEKCSESDGLQEAKKKAEKKTSIKSSKKSKEKKQEAPWIADALTFICGQVEANKDEVFSPACGTKVKAFKTGGHMYARINHSKTSISLMVKGQDIPEGVKSPDKNVNHMFDAGYIFTAELSSEDKKLIKQLLQASRQARVDKNNIDKTKAKKSEKGGK